MPSQQQDRQRHAEYRRRRARVRAGEPPLQGRAYCPECHHEIPIMRDGRMRRHNARNGSVFIAQDAFPCRAVL